MHVKSREVAMKNVQSYRAMGLICRQRAVFDPEHSWKHLGDAEKWEHLAHAEIADHFRECNAGSAELAASAMLLGEDRERRWLEDVGEDRVVLTKVAQRFHPPLRRLGVVLHPDDAVD